jgi:hypothetical protein
VEMAIRRYVDKDTVLNTKELFILQNLPIMILRLFTSSISIVNGTGRLLHLVIYGLLAFTIEIDEVNKRNIIMGKFCNMNSSLVFKTVSLSTYLLIAISTTGTLASVYKLYNYWLQSRRRSCTDDTFTCSNQEHWFIERLRVLWEGHSALLPSPEVQSSQETIDDLETYLLLEQRRLENLLHLIPNPDYQNEEQQLYLKQTNNINNYWKNDISVISYTLDTLASELDAIDCYGDLKLKNRKKKLSTLVVDLMEKCDALLAKFGIELISWKREEMDANI